MRVAINNHASDLCKSSSNQVQVLIERESSASTPTTAVYDLSEGEGD